MKHNNGSDCECCMCVAYRDSLIKEYFDHKSGKRSGKYNPDTPAKRAFKEIVSGGLDDDEIDFRIYVIKNQPDGSKFLEFLKMLGQGSMT